MDNEVAESFLDLEGDPAILIKDNVLMETQNRNYQDGMSLYFYNRGSSDRSMGKVCYDCKDNQTLCSIVE